MNLFIFITILSSFSLPVKTEAEIHAVYVSVLEISPDAELKQGKLMVKVFADDLEDAIFNFSKNRLNLQKGVCTLYTSEMELYLRQHIALSINQTSMVLTLRGCERMDMSLWLEFSFESPDIWRSIDIKADHLMELFPTQSNVISLTYQEQKRMFRLTNAKSSESIELD